MTTPPTATLALAVQGAAAAIAQEYIDRYANAEGRERVAWLRSEGRLELAAGTNPDGTIWGQFYDTERVKCWDGCDGVLTFHRAGWCPFVAEHADLDCACLDSGYDEDPYPEDGDPDFNEPDFDGFDEDHAIQMAERRYEAWIDRIAEPF